MLPSTEMDRAVGFDVITTGMPVVLIASVRFAARLIDPETNVRVNGYVPIAAFVVVSCTLFFEGF